MISEVRKRKMFTCRHPHKSLSFTTSISLSCSECNSKPRNGNESSSVLDAVIITSKDPWSASQAKFYPSLWYLGTKVHEDTSQNTLLFKLCFELQIFRSEMSNLVVQSV